jgi:MFS-type transporter involved in bile tolerance (Atg22 family)
MNITISTFIFTLLQSILGIFAGSLAEQYPKVAFWCGIGVAVSGSVLMTLKQFFGSPNLPNNNNNPK